MPKKSKSKKKQGFARNGLLQKLSSRSKVLIFVAIFAVAGAAFLLKTQAATTLISEDFSSSASAAQFTVIKGGTWTVANGTYNLTNAAATSDIINSNLSLNNTTVPAGDYTISADGQALATSGKYDDFTVNFGFTDINNYYYASFNESNDANTNGIFKVSGNTATQLQDFNSLIAGGTFYKIKIEKVGASVKVFRDGVLVGGISDPALTGGKVGFGTYNGNASFDNLVVTIPSAEPAPAPVPSPTPTPTPSPNPTPSPTPAPTPAAYSCTKTLAVGGNVQTFVDSLTSGQTGCLRGGTYQTSGTLYFKKAGVTVASTPGERAVINMGSNTSEISDSADNLTLRRIDFDSTNRHTIRVFGDNDVIEDTSWTNHSAAGAGACIGVGGTGGDANLAYNLTIRRSIFYFCGTPKDNLNHGVYAQSFRGINIVDNLFYANGGYSIQLYPDAQNAYVAHNVIDGGSNRGETKRGGIVIDGTSKNHNIERNIITNTASGTAGVVAKVTGGNQANYNCFYNTSGNISGTISQTGNITANPLFVNQATRDYRLQPGSGCLSVVQYDTYARIQANR